MHCHWANAAVTAGSYVMIEDSNNHQDITSAFVTQSNPVGTARSFNEAKFISCIFNKSHGGKSIRLMGDSMARHYFDNCYAISVDDVAVEIFKSTGISDLWLDIHVETTGCTKFLTIDNENPASTLNIHGLRIRDHQPFPNTALIDLTGTTRTVLMDDCDIDFGNPNSTIPIFGATGGAASKLQVSGVRRWHSAKNFTLANCLFNGTLYCQDGTAVTHTSGSYEIVRRPAAAGQRVKQVKGILQVAGAGEGTDLTNYVELEGAATGVSSRIAGKGDAGMTVIGGAGVATPLTLRATSGVGTTGADIVLQAGNNGATELARFFNSGNVSIGSATQGSRLHVYIINSSTAGAGPTFEQSGSGDMILQFLLTSTRAWVIGIDNSDSDKFKIHSGNSGFADRMMEIDVNGNTVVKGSLIVDPQAVTGAGALTLGKTYHSLSNSSGSTYAVTLAAPTAAEDGIVKAIKMIAGDGTNTVTLALTNVAGGSASTTATFDSAGETLIVQAAGGKWIVIKEFGVTLT
jgi:hypothetical protein